MGKEQYDSLIMAAEPSTAELAATNDQDVDDDDDDDAGYSVDHLSAVIRPVALTMGLAAIAVAKIRDPVQDAAISSGLSMYLVYNEGGGGGGGDTSTGDLLGQALINAIVIVCVIAGATFVLVGCYYFRCIKPMIAYLIFACVVIACERSCATRLQTLHRTKLAAIHQR